MPRWALRRDGTHTEIREAFRSCGCRVKELNGALDFLVLDGGVVRLCDAKSKRTPGAAIVLTPTQRRLVAEGWPICFPVNATEALDLVIAWRKAAR